MRPNRSIAVFTTRSPSGRLIASATTGSPLPPAFSMSLIVADDVRLGTCGADDRRTRLRQDSGNALPDALAGAGDDRDLAIQLELLHCHTGSSTGRWA